MFGIKTKLNVFAAAHLPQCLKKQRVNIEITSFYSKFYFVTFSSFVRTSRAYHAHEFHHLKSLYMFLSKCHCTECVSCQ